MSVKEIAELIARRDSISLNEAYEAIEQCQDELNEIMERGGYYDEAEECVAYWLGLEPDYLPDLLDC